MNRELRFLTSPIELRAADGDAAPVLSGYGATFDRLSQNLGGFVEVIDARAFDTTLSSGRNIMGAFNHDLSQLLATTDSGTLSLGVDDTGVRYDMTLDPSDPDAVRVMAKVGTGKVKGSSFAFATRDDAWDTTEDGFPLRRLLQVELYEIGPVVNPAYRSTEEDGAAVALRSLSKFVDLPFAQVEEAARVGGLDALIRRDLEVPADDAPEAPDSPEAPDQAQRRGRRNPPSR